MTFVKELGGFVKEWWRLFKKKSWNPKLLLLLVFVQLAFFASFAYIQITYQVPLMENLQLMLSELQDANYDTNLIGQGIPLLPSVGEFYTYYLEVIKYFKQLVFFTLLAIVVFESVSWALANYQINGKNLWRTWIKNLGAFLAVLVPLMIVLFFLLRAGIFGGPGEPPAQIYIWISFALGLISLYFLVTFFALSHRDVKKAKECYWFLTLKRWYWLIPTYLAVVALLIPFVMLFYYGATMWPFSVMLITLFIFLVAVVIAKLITVSAIERLDERSH